MRTPVTVDDILRLEGAALAPEERRKAAATLLGWAEERHPDDGATQAELAAALFDAGRPDEARQVAEDLRRARPRVVDIAGMAQVFELVGDLQQAHRWTAMGISRLDIVGEADPLEDADVELLLDVRRRVRAALGMPPDRFDDPAA